ncbi:MAG: hypothetical protein Q4Q17_03530 [Tissierellia bacterium]|nr:hypothetical protein [Tissierellia bacterium]
MKKDSEKAQNHLERGEKKKQWILYGVIALVVLCIGLVLFAMIRNRAQKKEYNEALMEDVRDLVDVVSLDYTYAKNSTAGDSKATLGVSLEDDVTVEGKVHVTIPSETSEVIKSRDKLEESLRNHDFVILTKNKEEIEVYLLNPQITNHSFEINGLSESDPLAANSIRGKIQQKMEGYVYGNSEILPKMKAKMEKVLQIYMKAKGYKEVKVTFYEVKEEQ